MIANSDACIKALQGAMMSRRKALLLELSVGLAVFCSAGDTDAMRSLKEIYESVGYECVHRDGKDYARVHYRASAVEALFKKLTMSVVIEWAGAKKNTAAINEIATHLNMLAFDSMESVRAYSLPKVEPVALVTAPAQETITTVPGSDHVYHIKSSHLKLDIPDSIDVSEIMDLARKLLALADRISKKVA